MKIDVSPPLQEATQLLVEKLLASEAFLHYQSARQTMDANKEAHALMDQLGQSQACVRQMQAKSQVNQAEIDALRLLQQRVLRDPVILDYLGSQQEVVNLLRDINREISDLLGVNFASFANHATC